MNSIIKKATDENIFEAAELIKSGKLVAFPTETVYGLGASAFIPTAVAGIFAAKGRPTFNPLISHIAEFQLAEELAEVDERARFLAGKYWPGPLTFVLKRKNKNPAMDLACAGLPTMTVRMPNHPIALELIRKSGVPIVAPSANRSQTISPTTAQHVESSIGENIDMILDGGECSVGVESTIIDLTTPQAVLLRAGGITLEELKDALGEQILISHGNPDMPSSPGQLLRHYAPSNHTLRINASEKANDEFLIGFGNVKGANINLSLQGDLREAAANLFAYLRLADEQTEFTKIAISPIPENDIGLAINDRIRRASYNK